MAGIFYTTVVARSLPFIYSVQSETGQWLVYSIHLSLSDRCRFIYYVQSESGQWQVWPETEIILLYNLIIHSSMNLF